MRIALLGLGLIGGSIALALRRAGAEASIAAWTPSGRGPREAMAAGAIDEAATSIAAAVEGADLIVLAAPPLECVGLLDALPRTDATITDVASTKLAMGERADAIGPGLHFVGGHPMAGREITGFEAATADLFDGRPWVVVPGAHSRPIDVERDRVACADRRSRSRRAWRQVPTMPPWPASATSHWCSRRRSSSR